mgnify:CR=1 FL=1
MHYYLGVSCPACKARKGQPCTYLFPKNGDGTFLTSEQVRRSSSKQVLDRVARAGQPMPKAHQERGQKARLKSKADEQQAVWDSLQPSRGRQEMLRANADAIQDETRQLTAWLAQHAHILG